MLRLFQNYGLWISRKLVGATNREDKGMVIKALNGFYGASRRGVEVRTFSLSTEWEINTMSQALIG